MGTIPATLVKALGDLGMSTYEASVYAALVLFNDAEAKEIIDYLGISKPSVYEALERLAEMGLAVKRVTKPAVYSAVAPDMAVSLLMDRHQQAADQALDALKNLEKEKIRTEKEDALWTIYGDTSIEYKIRDLFSKAKLNIRCVAGERYLPILRKCRTQDIVLRLLVFSDLPDLESELRKIFPGDHVEIHVVPRKNIPPMPPFPGQESSGNPPGMNFENILEISVDDEEMVWIPPFFSGTVSVLNTRNKGGVYQMNLMGEMMWRWLVEGGQPPFPLMPGEKPPRGRKKQG